VSEDKKSFIAVPLTGVDLGKRIRGTPRTAADGSEEAGEVVGLDTVLGLPRLSPTLLPPGVGPTIIAAVHVRAAEVGFLIKGHWVHVYDSAGTPEVRRANASGPTPYPANGYIVDTPQEIPPAGGNWYVDVYTDGINTQVPLGAWVAADLGKRVYLSKTAGEMTDDLSAYAVGDLVEDLGYIDAVGLTVSVDFMPGDEILLE